MAIYVKGYKIDKRKIGEMLEARDEEDPCNSVPHIRTLQLDATSRVDESIKVALPHVLGGPDVWQLFLRFFALLNVGFSSAVLSTSSAGPMQLACACKDPFYTNGRLGYLDQRSRELACRR